MRRLAWLFCVGAGCNVAFGIATQAPPLEGSDLDGDGIADDQDPCIAPASDAAADIDGDAIADAMDPCPLRATADPTNADHDDLEDACDPSVGSIDTLRCVMAFTDVGVSDRLWQPITGLIPFGHLAGKLHCNHGDDCGALAAESLEPASSVTTYEVRTTVATTLGEIGGVAIWPRLGPTGTAGEVGCAFVNSTGAYSVAIFEDSTVLSRVMAQPLTGSTLFLRASISSGPQATFTCNASFDGTYDPTTERSVVVPAIPGTFGVTSSTWGTDILGLAVIQSP